MFVFNSIIYIIYNLLNSHFASFTHSYHYQISGTAVDDNRNHQWFNYLHWLDLAQLIMLMVLKKANCQTFLASSCYCYGLFFFVSFLFQQKVPAIHDSFIRTLLPKSTSSSFVGVETSLTLLIFIISLNCFITNYPTPAQTKLPFFFTTQHQHKHPHYYRHHLQVPIPEIGKPSEQNFYDRLHRVDAGDAEDGGVDGDAADWV